MKTKDESVSRRDRAAGFHRNVRRIWVATVACCVSAGSILVPGAAKAASPIPITACQSITATGYYQVQKALSSAGGDCLVIQASNVTLDLNGYAISGAGTGAGIHVLATAPGTKTGKEDSGTKTEAEGKGTKTGTQIKGVFIEGRGAIISLFATGIEDDAIGTFGDYFDVNSNTGDGLLLKGAQGGHYSALLTDSNGGSGVHVRLGSGNTLVAVESDSNKAYGVWFDASSNNSLDGDVATGNVISGYYLGCSPNGPNGVSCAQGSSSSNLIFGSLAFSGFQLPQQYGIAVDLGNTNNRIAENQSTSNTIDMLDKNVSCGTDIWFYNLFGTASPPASCIN